MTRPGHFLANHVKYGGIGHSVKILLFSKNSARQTKVLVVGYAIKDRFGQVIFGTNTHHLSGAVESVVVGEMIEYAFQFPANFGVGTYSVAVAAHRDEVHIGANYEWRDLATIFNVISGSESQFVGSAWIPPALEVTR